MVPESIQTDVLKAPPISAVAPLIIGGPQISSSIVRGSNGKFYELKLSRDDAPNCAANEMLGAYLIRELGFAGPQFASVALDGRTIDALRANRNRAFRQLLPQDGICCAVEFPVNNGYELRGWLTPHAAANIANAADLFGIFVFDTWASQQEQRQCRYLKHPGSRSYEAHFFNNSYLFGGRDWRHVAEPARLPACIHLTLPKLNDPVIDEWIQYFEDRLPLLFERCVDNLPAAWYAGDINQLTRMSFTRLRNLRSAVSNQMIVQQRRCKTRSRGSLQNDRLPERQFYV